MHRKRMQSRHRSPGVVKLKARAAAKARTKVEERAKARPRTRANPKVTLVEETKVITKGKVAVVEQRRLREATDRRVDSAVPCL